MLLPGVEDITAALWAITKMAASMAPPRITTNLTHQPITTNLTPPQRITTSLTLPRITANPTPLLTPPRRMVGKLTVVAGNLTVVAESTTSQ